MIEIDIKIKLLTIYYLQIDRQTERVNQSLETYLQYYVNHSQKNWIQLLPMAQMAHNNKKTIATKQTLFYMNHRRHLTLFIALRISP